MAAADTNNFCSASGSRMSSGATTHSSRISPSIPSELGASPYTFCPRYCGLSSRTCPHPAATLWGSIHRVDNARYHRLALQWQVDGIQRAHPFRGQTGNYSANPDEPNLATVKVPDARLDRLTEMFRPEKRVPADVQYLDVAGIAKGIAKKGMSGACSVI